MQIQELQFSLQDATKASQTEQSKAEVGDSGSSGKVQVGSWGVETSINKLTVKMYEFLKRREEEDTQMAESETVIIQVYKGKF